MWWEAESSPIDGFRSLKSAGRTAGRGRGGVRWETPVMMRREQADLTRSVV